MAPATYTNTSLSKVHTGLKTKPNSIMSQTTHTSMSSLTTPDGEDDDLVELVETPLPPLKSVFDCPNIELCIVNGKSGWKCH